MYKIVHIITRLDMGGSAQNTFLTCLGLNNERYEMILAHGPSHESQMTDHERQSVARTVKEAQEAGVRVTPIPSLVRRIDPLSDLRAFFSIWKLLIRETPSIVHTHTSKAGLLGRWGAKMAGVPLIVHTPHGHVFYGHFGPLASKFFLLLERISASITDRMIAVSEGEKRDYIALSVSEPAKLVIVHSGVDIDRFSRASVNVDEKKRTLDLRPERLVVGSVGWLLAIKGPMFLLKAMDRVWQDCPDVELAYVGKGEMEPELRAEALRMGRSDKVKFLGWRDDVNEIMHVLDLFVLPSLNEGMGRVLVEAMAAGKPIVASNVGGIPDLIKHGETGLLVPPGNAQALGEAILQILTDQEKAKEMGEKGRAFCPAFSVQAMLDKLDTLYQELLKEKCITW